MSQQRHVNIISHFLFFLSSIAIYPTCVGCTTRSYVNRSLGYHENWLIVYVFSPSHSTKSYPRPRVPCFFLTTNWRSSIKVALISIYFKLLSNIVKTSGSRCYFQIQEYRIQRVYDSLSIREYIYSNLWKNVIFQKICYLHDS